LRRLTDEELMRRVQAGDLACFEQIVDRYKRVVYGLARCMLRSREDAEEAAQDTFVKLFRARDQFDAARALEPWLLRIAGNTCRDRLRLRRHSRLPVATDPDGGSVAHLIIDQRASRRTNREATEQVVRHELDRLSGKLRVPLELKYLGGLTNRQIAESLGISVTNVKVRVARAKDLLFSRLDRVLEA
jgi:RNA polymerase sigma-70 factor (ECF subfamily)